MPVHKKIQGRGAISSDTFKKLARKGGLSAVFMAVALAVPLANAPVEAQEAPRTGATYSSDVSDYERATQTRLAYIRTGSRDYDQMTEAGLRGLGIMLFERTAVENTVLVEGADGEAPRWGYAPVTPIGLDVENDDLAFYPILFWTVDPARPMPSAKAIQNLNNYMRNGGLLVIDTRDEATAGRGSAWLRQAADRGLAIGSLAEVKGCKTAEENCHVLGKSFYLMESFPGRYGTGKVWTERNPAYAQDRVSPVIIGSNEWVAAWATDEDGRYLYAIQGDEEQREQAFRFGINLVIYALTGNYKSDLVHTPSILERMGPK